MTETTTPILPCRTIDPTLDFYRALGFEVTYRQTRPNPYASVVRGGIELHFFGMKAYDPSTSYSTCYVHTTDVDGLYAAFREGLRAAYGKLPVRGIPRIGPLKDMPYGVRQFLMTDPGGNAIRVGQPISDSSDYEEEPREPFARVVHTASLLADSKEDFRTAAKLLDRALAKHEDPPALDLVRALLLRADLAVRLGAPEEAAPLMARAAGIELGERERAELADELRWAGDLAAELRDLGIEGSADGGPA
ncbi:VOC family protein [Streptomyces sp. URMC 123]|uniref:VOC family protein n=1 Tax=Streptomyces sp. URMC 123 TaxID=3423403 RepID=UPI003F19B754